MCVWWPNMVTVFVGCGAGFAGDRYDAAIPVVNSLSSQLGPRYLIYEVLAERTLAIAQRERLLDTKSGYSSYLDLYLEAILAKAKSHNIRIITNMGAANPAEAAVRIVEIANKLHIGKTRVGVVSGDNLLENINMETICAEPTIEGIDLHNEEIIAANVYLGATPIVEALRKGADIVVVGRTTDSALTLGPLIFEFGWDLNNWNLLAQGTLAGHLLECGAQVSGAYFADPGFKNVPNLAEVGFPIAEVSENGNIIISKAARTGGLVSRATVLEQALYEVHDPKCYLTPDVTLDISQIQVNEIGEDRVSVKNARGSPPPKSLKASISINGGWLGEAEITYAGVNALARAKLATEILKRRLHILGIKEVVRLDIIGLGSVFDNNVGAKQKDKNVCKDGEFRVRAAVRSDNRETAQRVSDEVLSLYCSGPAAGGGVRQSLNPQVKTTSILVNRDWVTPRVQMLES